MPRQEQDDLTEAEAIPLGATGATRRRAERGSARLLERLQRQHPERAPRNRAAKLQSMTAAGLQRRVQLFRGRGRVNGRDWPPTLEAA